MGIVKMVNEL